MALLHYGVHGAACRYSVNLSTVNALPTILFSDHFGNSLTEPYWFLRRYFV